MLSFIYFKKLLAYYSTFHTSQYWFKSLYNYSTISSSFAFLYIFNFKQLNNFASILNVFNIYFFRKEVFYTKLKYSRVPQFDTSATASAAFLSASVGILICEKTGFELMDGGDFLYLILYLGIVYWSLTHLVRLMNSSTFLLSYWFLLGWSLVKSIL